MSQRPLKDPVLPACPHRPPCPGCPRYGEFGIAPTAHGALTELARAHAVPEVAVVSGHTVGFRHRARLAIRGRLGSPKIGLFELGTHHVVHIPNCVVQHPLINRVAGVVRRALVDARITSYSDNARLGLARYLQVVVERRSQSAQVVLVGNSESPEPLAACFQLIREQLGGELHSLWFNSNREPTNSILGPDFHLICGPEASSNTLVALRCTSRPARLGRTISKLPSASSSTSARRLRMDARGGVLLRGRRHWAVGALSRQRDQDE